MADDAAAWSAAWHRAAFGPDGFYRSERGRAENHFHTSVMQGDAVARRLIEVAEPVLREIVGAGSRVTVTDVGAADGTLIRQLISAWPADLSDVTDWRCFDVRERPRGLHPRVSWISGDILDTAARSTPCPGLVVTHELLDDIPCDIVEPDDDGHLRLILVDPSSGAEFVGPPLDDVEACARLGVDSERVAAWCSAWWPRRQSAARIEVGSSRDDAWRAIGSLVSTGLAVAIDYGHVLAERTVGKWDGGTLAAYANHRPTSAVPDGSCNITAHVAVDSCAAALPSIRTSLTPSPGHDDFWWLVQYR